MCTGQWHRSLHVHMFICKHPDRLKCRLPQSANAPWQSLCVTNRKINAVPEFLCGEESLAQTCYYCSIEQSPNTHIYFTGLTQGHTQHDMRLNRRQRQVKGLTCWGERPNWQINTGPALEHLRSEVNLSHTISHTHIYTPEKLHDQTRGDQTRLTIAGEERAKDTRGLKEESHECVGVCVSVVWPKHLRWQASVSPRQSGKYYVTT